MTTLLYALNASTATVDTSGSAVPAVFALNSSIAARDTVTLAFLRQPHVAFVPIDAADAAYTARRLDVVLEARLLDESGVARTIDVGQRVLVVFGGVEVQYATGVAENATTPVPQRRIPFASTRPVRADTPWRPVCYTPVCEVSTVHYCDLACEYASRESARRLVYVNDTTSAWFTWRLRVNGTRARLRVDETAYDADFEWPAATNASFDGVAFGTWTGGLEVRALTVSTWSAPSTTPPAARTPVVSTSTLAVLGALLFIACACAAVVGAQCYLAQRRPRRRRSVAIERRDDPRGGVSTTSYFDLPPPPGVIVHS